MDVVEVIMNLDQIEARYEPILGAATFEVEGYIIHGYYQDESLAPLFHDEDVPLEYQLEVSRQLERLAAERLRDTDYFVIFRCRPEWLLEEGGEAFLTPLRELNFPLERMLVALRGTELVDVSRLSRIVHYYRSSGVRVALDFAESTSLEDMIAIAPEMLLVDLGTMVEKKTLSATYPHLLQTMEYVASKLGASLLYKSVDHLGQLKYAWQHGGSYYMGRLLSTVTPEPLTSVKGLEVLRQEVPEFIRHDQGRLKALFALELRLQKRFTELVQSGKWSQDTQDEWLLHIASMWNGDFVRFYVTDQTGFQTSANVYKDQNGWKLDERYRGYNWSFRPYFIRTLAAMEVREYGLISDYYRDFSSNEITRTFSFPLPNQLYLFADMSESFLYEHRLID